MLRLVEDRLEVATADAGGRTPQRTKNIFIFLCYFMFLVLFFVTGGGKNQETVVRIFEGETSRRPLHHF